MKLVTILLIISIIGNLIGLFILYKFNKKNEYLAEVEAKLKRKDEVLNEVNQMLSKRLVFIHHSVGRNWLLDGLKDELTALGISVQSLSRKSELGMETDINHWLPKFENNIEQIFKFDNYAENNQSEKENDIIMFKSCYPNSNIIGEGAERGDPYSAEKTISNYKSVFDSLKNIISQHPQKTFLYVTSPPIHKMKTNSENAARARKFNNWIKTDFVNRYKEETGLNNFIVFDFFDILADENNVLKAEYVRREGDSHPNSKANRAAAKAFIEFYKKNF